MATQLQLRKGTKVQNDAFTGAEGELTYDSTTKGIRIHDGITQGGHEIPMLIAVQRPTAENDYTWYRLWSDGWVEQGQKIIDTTTTITLPVEMENDWYTITTAQNGGASGTISRCAITNQTTTGFTIVNSAANMRPIFWQVSGMAKLS